MDPPTKRGMLKPTEASPLLPASPDESRRFFVNYVFFAAAFGCNYGSLKASTAYLSSVFPHETASRANAFMCKLRVPSGLQPIPRLLRVRAYSHSFARSLTKPTVTLPQMACGW